MNMTEYVQIVSSLIVEVTKMKRVKNLSLKRLINFYQLIDLYTN